MDRYRQGLYNGYDLVIPGGEAVVEFEARVLSWLGEVRAGATSDVWIMTHRSVVTALTIHFARQVFGYPVDFYGYIDVPLLGGLVVEGFEGDPGPNGVYIVDDLESVVR